MTYFKSIAVFLVCACLYGCSTPPGGELYGMQVTEPLKELFIIHPRDKDGKFTFSSVENSTNPKVKASGVIRKGALYLRIVNGGSTRIPMSYDLDTYIVQSTRGITYTLKKTAELNYPTIDYIEPGKEVHLRLSGCMDAEKISFVAVRLGNNTYILLQQIPDYVPE